MKLTCLGGEGGAEGKVVTMPPCFMLDMCHTRVLLECPIDIFCLLQFLPTVETSYGNRHQLRNPMPHLRSTNNGAVAKGDNHQMKKMPRLNAKSSGGDENFLWKRLGESYFLNCAPWYKTPDFSHFDVTSVNAVLISNPVAMLGLPLLFRNPDFTAKVYVTDATAKFGQLMMEELVSLHKEFLQIHGRPTTSSIPPWLHPKFAVTMPEGAQKEFVSSNSAREQWHQLYNIGDVRACMAKVHRLQFGEEGTVDGLVRVTPMSAGYAIGSSNWIITGAYRSFSYISASISQASCAQSLDLSALEPSPVLLFSGNNVMEPKDNSGELVRESIPVKVENFPGRVAGAQELLMNEIRLVSEDGTAPRASSQRTSPNPSPTSLLAVSGVTNSIAGNLHKSLSASQMLQAIQERSGKILTEEVENIAASTPVDERLVEICNAGLETLRGGGSVLIPINPNGTFLELMEEMSETLKRTGLESVPIFFISPVAEELLAFSNTVPEWLCSARQDKLYAGEALFGFVDALKEKRLLLLPALQSSDLTKCWQEPCVVFASHWSLRAGSAVHLLHHWRMNHLCLLVLTEPHVDNQALMAPFLPMAMQVLNRPLTSNLRSEDLEDILQKLKPKLMLVSESLQGLLDRQSFVGSNVRGTLTYKTWKTLKIPRFSTQSELQVELSADLALQIQLKELRAGKMAAAHLRAELRQKDGNWFLDLASPSAFSKGVPFGSLPRNQIRWGTLKLESLLSALRERGMSGLSVGESFDQGGEDRESPERKITIIEVASPSQATVKVGSGRIHVHTNDPPLRLKIVEAVNILLNVL